MKLNATQNLFGLFRWSLD